MPCQAFWKADVCSIAEALGCCEHQPDLTHQLRGTVLLADFLHHARSPVSPRMHLTAFGTV